MLTPEQIEQVITAIKERYVLTEKNFNLRASDPARDKAEAFIHNVINQLCLYYRISLADFQDGHFTYKTTRRLIVYHLSRDMPEKPIKLTWIGGIFKKNHSSILSALRGFDRKYKYDSDFRLEYLAIKEMVEQSLKL